MFVYYLQRSSNRLTDIQGHRPSLLQYTGPRVNYVRKTTWKGQEYMRWFNKTTKTVDTQLLYTAFEVSLSLSLSLTHAHTHAHCHSPLTQSTTTSAPSVTRRAAVTSLEKSTWPGESIRLIRKPFPSFS